jgi:hypothetical protein
MDPPEDDWGAEGVSRFRAIYSPYWKRIHLQGSRWTLEFPHPAAGSALAPSTPRKLTIRLVVPGLHELATMAAAARICSVQLGRHEDPQVALHLLASQPHGTYVELFHPIRDPP